MPGETITSPLSGGWKVINTLLGAAGTSMGATALGSKTSENRVREIIAEELGGCRGRRGGWGGYGSETVVVDSCNENTLVNRYELAQSQRIAELESEKVTDAKLLDLYKQTVAENKAIRAEIADVVATNEKAHETIYKELVANRERELIHNGHVDKELALLRQADFFRNQLNDCRYVTAKKVVAKDDICPEVMPRFNSWVAPTATAGDATETPAG